MLLGCITAGVRVEGRGVCVEGLWCTFEMHVAHGWLLNTTEIKDLIKARKRECRYLCILFPLILGLWFLYDGTN